MPVRRRLVLKTRCKGYQSGELGRFSFKRLLTLSDVVRDVVSVEGLVGELSAVDVEDQGAGVAEAVARGVNIHGVVPLEQVEDAACLEMQIEYS